LIIVALLINFTPVILGLIVDASNILMDHFLKSIQEEKSNPFQAIKGEFSKIHYQTSNDWKKQAEEAPKKKKEGEQQISAYGYSSALLGKTVVEILFAVIAGFIFFLFAALFVMRYIAIWTAVILSPLAFVCLILPATKKYWEMWWKQFLSWCFIGVITAFFLYLSQQIIKMAEEKNLTYIFASETDTTAEGLLNSLLPWGVVIAFLLIGLFTSITISAMGANTIVSFSKRGGKAAGKGAARFASRQTLGRLATSKTGKAAGGWLARRQIPRIREAKTTLGKLGAIAAAPLIPFRYAVQKVGAGLLSYSARQQEEINKIQERIEKRFGKDYKSMAAYVSSLADTNYQGKIAGAQALAKTKGAKGLKELPDSELNSIIEKTNRYAPAMLANLVKHKPELVDDAQIGNIVRKNLVSKGLGDEEVKKVVRYGVEPAVAIRKAAFKKAVEALKQSDIENLADETISHEEFQEAVARYKPWSFIRKIGEERGAGAVAVIQEKAQKIGIEEIAKTNPGFLRVAYTPGGQAYLGNWRRDKGKGKEIKDKEGISEIINNVSPPLKKEEAEKKIEEYKKQQTKVKPTSPRDTGKSEKRTGGTDTGKR